MTAARVGVEHVARARAKRDTRRLALLVRERVADGRRQARLRPLHVLNIRPRFEFLYGFKIKKISDFFKKFLKSNLDVYILILE